MDEPTLSVDEEIEIEEIEERIFELEEDQRLFVKVPVRAREFGYMVVGGVSIWAVASMILILTQAPPWVAIILMIAASWAGANRAVWLMRRVHRVTAEELAELRVRRAEIRGRQYAVEDERYGKR